jgi:hypothetical protein
VDGITNSTFTPKSFWARKEGTVGMVVVVLIALAVVMVLPAVLAFIISLLEQTLTAIALFIAVGTILFFASQKRTWTIIGGLFKLVMYHATNIFITIDPVGIVRNHVKSLREKIQEMSDGKSKMRGDIAALQGEKEKNTQEISHCLSIVKEAKRAVDAGDEGKKFVMVQNANQAKRLQSSNDDYDKMLARMQAMYAVLGKYIDAASFTADDAEANVNEAIRKKRMMDRASSTMGLAKRILLGQGDETDVYNQTMEYMAEDYGKKLGEIQDFMDVSKPIIDKFDLQNMAGANEVLDNLDAWVTKTDSLILSDQGKAKQITEGTDSSMSLLKLPAKARVKVASTNQ